MKHIFAAFVTLFIVCAHAAGGAAFDCVPDSPSAVHSGASAEGSWLSWPCDIEGGYGRRWNRIVWPDGYVSDFPAIYAALAAPNRLAAVNALLAGRGCDDSPLVRRLCDAAQADERRTVLPAQWVTRAASWGGVGVYGFVDGQLQGTILQLHGRNIILGSGVECDCMAFRRPIDSDRAWCIAFRQGDVLGAAACYRNK